MKVYSYISLAFIGKTLKENLNPKNNGIAETK